MLPMLRTRYVKTTLPPTFSSGVNGPTADAYEYTSACS
jgi:hypothetical protein